MSLLSTVLYRNPLTDPQTGLVTSAWAQWFAALAIRVGGPDAGTNSELDFATQLDIREADDAEERKAREVTDLLTLLGYPQALEPPDRLALELWWAAQDSALAALQQRVEALSLEVSAADALLAGIREGLNETQVLAIESFFSTVQAQPSPTGASTSPPPKVDNASVTGTTTRYAREDHTHQGVNLDGAQTITGAKTFSSPINMNGQNLTNVGGNSIEVLSGTAAPSAGAGVVGTIGSLYGRDNAGAGELWVKTGAADTAWTQVTIP